MIWYNRFFCWTTIHVKFWPGRDNISQGMFKFWPIYWWISIHSTVIRTYPVAFTQIIHKEYPETVDSRKWGNSYSRFPILTVVCGTGNMANKLKNPPWFFSMTYHVYYIYIPGKLGLCFHFWCSVYDFCKRADTLWPVGRVRLFADYTISLSSLCRLIWRHWTKMLARYMLPSVCLRLRQFSQLSFIQYMGLCVFSLPISPVMIVRMCTLSYYHHQTGSMNH